MTRPQYERHTDSSRWAAQYNAGHRQYPCIRADPPSKWANAADPGASASPPRRSCRAAWASSPTPPPETDSTARHAPAGALGSRSPCRR